VQAVQGHVHHRPAAVRVLLVVAHLLALVITSGDGTSNSVDICHDSSAVNHLITNAKYKQQMLVNIFSAYQLQDAVVVADDTGGEHLERAGPGNDG
jgi:hypothetical protein